jgi:hypothetical protein
MKGDAPAMTNILDTVARQCGSFLPSRPEHYLAIQIAKKLPTQKRYGIIWFYLNITPSTFCWPPFTGALARGN